MTNAPWSTKVGLALASTLFALGVAWLVLRDRGPVTTVTTRFVDAPQPDHTPPVEPVASATPSELTGVDPFTAGSLHYPASTFRRHPLSDEEWRRYSDIRDSKLLERDRNAYFRYRSGIDERIEWPEHPRGFFRARTNSLGLRGAEEVRVERPDLRILITGDSHTDGVCDPDEAFTKLLERQLAEHAPGRSIEALNAGVGGYSFYHYLGVLERYLPLVPDVFVVAVYGGNDFEEGLTLHHAFQGTTRPPGSAIYRDQFNAACEIQAGAVMQGLLAVKYFTQNPDQVEVALQMARDVSTEIEVTCWRNGIRPIFVYIPPLHDVEWDRHHEELEAVAGALHLEREHVRVSDQIADSFVAFLRSTRVDVVDMRETFRASNEALYWRADYHINLAAHRLIAARLLPVVEAAVPATAVRVRSVAPRAGKLTLLSPGAAPRDGDGVERGTRVEPPRPFALPERARRLTFEQVDRALVEAWFELGPRYEFDPHTLFRYAAHVSAPTGTGVLTNSLGLLGAREPSPVRATSSPTSLRVLLAADEAVFALGDEGPACGESIEKLVRAARPELSVECLDATTAGWGFFQYLGALERLQTLAPDVFVVAVDCGGDFLDALGVQRALGGKTGESGDHAPTRRRVEAARTCIDVARILADMPGDLLASLHSALSVTAEIARRCSERGTRFVLVLLPPASDLRVQACRESVAARSKDVGLGRAELKLLERLTESYRLALGELDVAVLDFGSVAEGSSEVLYDCDTLRLSVLGRQRLAELIAARIAAQDAPRRER